jgi:hypothetical protein
MGSGNGMASAYGTQQPPDAYNAPQPTETAVVKIDLGLSGRQILGAFTALGTFLVTAFTAGWLFLPARDSDLKTLQGVVEIVRQQQLDFQRQLEASRDAVSRMTMAIDNLSGVVEGLRQTPPKVIEKIIQAPRSRARPPT